MDIRIAGIQDDSIVDGEGIRLIVFSQGCPHHCPGCHNPETWPMDSGRIVTTDAIMEQYLANPMLDGITFSGGEPFWQAQAFAELADKVHAHGGNVWCYTGFSLNGLIKRGSEAHKTLLSKVDVLVDGQFKLDQKDLTLQFRGSRNQNIWRRTGADLTDWEPWQPKNQNNVA